MSILKHYLRCGLFGSVAVCVSLSSPAVSQNAAVEEVLKVPGARVTLTVEAAKKPFQKDFVNQAQNAFESFHDQMGGDHTLYYLQNFASVMRTDLVSPNPVYTPFEYALIPRLRSSR